MTSPARWLPLLLVLAAGLGVALLLLEAQTPEGSADAFDRELDPLGTGADLTGHEGLALTGELGRHRPSGAPETTPDVNAPALPTFAASEGIAGRVLDGKGVPIDKATVTLHPFPLNSFWGAADEPALAETKTGKDGAFLVGPAPEGRVKVRAVAPGFAPSVVPVPRRGSRIEITLDVGGALAVKVVDGKGAALAEASVQHIAGAWGAQVVTEALTNKEGLARFDAVPTGSGQVIVTKPGLGLVRQPDVAVPPQQLTELTVVLQGGRELAGQVLNADDQRPVTGASLEVHYPWVQGVKPSVPVQTDEDGRYKVSIDVPTGEQFELRVRAPGFAETRLWLNYNDSGSGSMKHDVRLSQGAQGLSGRVSGRDAGAVSGATVTYGGAQPGQTMPSATTDAEGRFELPAPVWGGPGSSWWVIATHASEGVGHAHAALPGRNDPRGKQVEIRLTGCGGIDGLVKDGAGQAVEGAAISITPDWSAMERNMRSGRGFDWQLMNLLQDPKVGGRLTAVSDAEGRYAIPGVPAFTYQVAALWGGLTATHESPVEVKGGQTSHADLVLGEGASIEGLVLDTEDRPVAGAMLWAQAMQNRPGMTAVYPNARSQSDGRFTLRGVGPGAYQINAAAAGYGNDVAKNVVAGTRDVTIKLKSLGWIDGQVLLDNQPYSGTFQVSFARQDSGPGGSPRRMGNFDGNDGGGEAQTFNHPEGRFQKRGLSGGEYTLTASTPEGLVVLEPGSARVVEGRGAGPVALRLQQGATLVGEAEGADGRPLANAWLYAQPVKGEGAGPGASARTDEKGLFRLRGLGTGAYRVQIGTDQGVQWSEQVDLLVGSERRARFVERLPGRVRVTVQDEDGAPLAKARPMLHDAANNEVHPNWQLLRRENIVDGRTSESWERATTTDASGQCTRHHVPPGRYRVSAALQGYESQGEGAWVDVGAGAVTDVTLTLKRTP
jgi:protocatechuate 3,4-dioxygenase beta subunit